MGLEVAEFDIEVAFSTLNSNVGKTNDNLKKLERARPIATPWGVAGTGTGTLTLVVPGRPQAGRMWYVHRVVVLGADGHTGVGGALCDVYAGPSISADATSQMYSGLLVPTIVEEGRYHNPVQFGEQVYAIFYNLPANQQVQFAIAVYDYPYASQLATTGQG